MIVLGADMHKSSHTLAAVAAATGEMLDEKTAAVGARGFDAVLRWARGLGPERVWALGGLPARVRVLRAVSDRSRRAGGSGADAADGQHAALEPRARQVRSHRRDRGRARRAGRGHRRRCRPPSWPGRSSTSGCSSTIASGWSGTRVGLNNTLQWHLHDLWPELVLPGSSLFYGKWGPRIARRLARAEQTMRVRIARDELRRLRELTQAINALETEIAEPGRPGRAAAARRAGLRAADRRQARRRDRRRRALLQRRQARSSSRPGTDPGQLRPHRSPPARSRRQPPDQRRHPPRRRHPRALSPRDDRVPRAQEDRRQDPPRSHPLAQAPPRPPHLAAATRAPPGVRNAAPPINFLTKEQQKQRCAELSPLARAVVLLGDLRSRRGV